MPFVSPSSSDVLHNTTLTNLSVAYYQEASDFIADRAFPVINVAAQRGDYYVVNEVGLNRNKMQPRAPLTEAAVGNWSLAKQNYAIEVAAYAVDYDDQVLSNARATGGESAVLDVDAQATADVTHKALIYKEKLWAESYFKPGNPGDTWNFVAEGVSSGATAPASFDPTDNANNKILQWSDGSSTPIEDIRRAKRSAFKASSKRLNIGVAGRGVYDTLLDHPDLVGRVDRGQTVGAAKNNLDSLAQLFELDEILVMDAIEDVATNNSSVATNERIGGNHFLLAHRPTQAGLLTPSAGYTFNWTGYMGSVQNGFEISKYSLGPRIKGTRVEVETAFTQKIISKNLGYLFTNMVVGE